MHEIVVKFATVTTNNMPFQTYLNPLLIQVFPTLLQKQFAGNINNMNSTNQVIQCSFYISVSTPRGFLPHLIN